LSNLFLKFEPAQMLRNATYVSIASFLAITYAYFSYIALDQALFISVIIGCVSGLVIGLITEYYTGSTPVMRVAESSQTGAATNIIYGLSVGMESTAAPIILLSLAILFSFTMGGGLFGVSLAAV